MNGTNNKKAVYTPPPTVDLSDPNDAEVWLDLVTSALKGFCAAGWSNEKGRLQMPSSSVASRAAIEAADLVLAEFKKRRK